MPIDREKMAKGNGAPGYYERIKRSWDSGHEVALTDYGGINLNGNKYTGSQLVCECDFKDEATGVEECLYKKEVRKLVQAEIREKYKKRWKRMDLEDKVFDIYTKHNGGEYLGQYYYQGKGNSPINIQDISDILKVSIQNIRSACDKLFALEKLDLYGMMLVKYVKRFRFPREIQQMFIWLFNSRLTHPETSGEDIDNLITDMELAINNHTIMRSGRRVFGVHNYPNIEPRILLLCAKLWMLQAVEKDEYYKDVCNILHAVQEKIRDLRK